jgi:glycosyltransferase involved in cell wall biosynthesis
MEQLISVVVPIYKVEPYLRRCVDSILQQTYRNLEVILVDDGSPDQCGAICDQYQLQDQRVVVIHKKNGGLSDARNAGTDIAKGELLLYVDSDDWLHQECLARMQALLSQHEADMVICNYLITNQMTLADPPLPEAQSEVFEGTKRNELLWHSIEPQSTQHGKIVVAWGKLYKRSLVGNIRYPIGKIHEDAFVTHQLLYAAKTIVLTQDTLFYYFQRDTSINGAGFDIRKRLNMLEAYWVREEFFRQHNLLELAAHCCKLYFSRIFNIDKHLANHQDTSQVTDLAQKRQQIKIRLDQYPLSWKFRAFYKIYYLYPPLFLFFYNLAKNTDE